MKLLNWPEQSKQRLMCTHIWFYKMVGLGLLGFRSVGINAIVESDDSNDCFLVYINVVKPEADRI